MKLQTIIGLLLISFINLAFTKTLPSSEPVVTKEIPLNTVNKTFKKQLAKILNKRECEKKIFVKKAHISSDGKLLNVNLTTRITRQYCTRRAKKQLYEKTKSIRFGYLLSIDAGKVVLTESTNNDKQYTFERSLTDVIGKNSKKAVAEIVKNILGLNNDTVNYQSIGLDSDKITVKFIPEK